MLVRWCYQIHTSIYNFKFCSECHVAVTEIVTGYFRLSIETLCWKTHMALNCSSKWQLSVQLTRLFILSMRERDRERGGGGKQTERVEETVSCTCLSAVLDILFQNKWRTWHISNWGRRREVSHVCLFKHSCATVQLVDSKLSVIVCWYSGAYA